MARYRDGAEKSVDTTIETIDKACPICKGIVKGNDAYLFYCKRCNILFKREELFLENPERLRDIVEKKIIEKYERDKDKLKIAYGQIKPKNSGHVKIKNKRENNVKVINRKNFHNTEKNSNSGKHLFAHMSKHLSTDLSTDTYVASKSSNTLHVASCPFVKNIKKSNMIQFHSLVEARMYKTYKHCKCMQTL